MDETYDGQSSRKGNRKRLFPFTHQKNIVAANSSQWRTPRGNVHREQWQSIAFGNVRQVQAYGDNNWHELFTERQLTGTTFNALVTYLIT